MDDAFDAIRHGAAIRNHEDDLRRAVLDDCVSEIAQQLYRASGAHLNRIVKPWNALSMEAQGEFLTRAKAMVAGESALMRLRARASTWDAVKVQMEGLAEAPEFDDLLTEPERWLCQQVAEIARDEYPRALVREYEGGRR
jgi:hypothetical protein